MNKEKKLKWIKVAIVLWVVLGLVMAMASYTQIYYMIFNIECVDNPTNEIVTKIQRAQSGVVASISDICLDEGENISSGELLMRIANVEELSLSCDSQAEVCKNKIKVQDNIIKILEDTKIKGLVTCTKFQSEPDVFGRTDRFNCELKVQDGSPPDPPDYSPLYPLFWLTGLIVLLLSHRKVKKS